MNYFIVFKRFRTECNRMLGMAYKTYISGIESNMKSNYNSFWSYVNGLKDTIPRKILASKYFGDSEFENSNLMIFLIRYQFGSIYNTSWIIHNSQIVQLYEIL